MLYEGVEGGKLRGIHSVSVVGHELYSNQRRRRDGEITRAEKGREVGERVHGWGGCSEVREGEGGSEEIASLSQSRYQALFGCIFHSNTLWGG